MRVITACLAFASLAGCSAKPPLVASLASHDVPCLHHHFYDLASSFTDAMTACGTRKPDLTGSGGLQQAALEAKVPFTIRPHADVYLKQAQAETITGDLIPHVGAGASFTPQNGVFETTMPLSDGH